MSPPLATWCCPKFPIPVSVVTFTIPHGATSDPNSYDCAPPRTGAIDEPPPLPDPPPPPVAANVDSSLGTISTKKSNMSVFVIALAMSFLCNVLLLFSSECIQLLSVNSKINISHAFANNTGASELIIRTSSSVFMIFLILASGN